MDKYKYLLFDADNTLLDFDQSSSFAFKAMINTYRPGSAEELYAIYYKINKACWAAVERGEIALSDVKWIRFEQFIDAIGLQANPHEMNEAYFDLLRESVFFVQEAQFILKELQTRGIGMSIITNGLKEVQERRFELAGINDFFDKIIISDAIGVKKPERAFFEHTSKLVPNFNKEEFLVIGDTPGSDILGAYDFGLPSCWFNPNKKEWLESDYAPNHTISKLTEILELV